MAEVNGEDRQAEVPRQRNVNDLLYNKLTAATVVNSQGDAFATLELPDSVLTPVTFVEIDSRDFAMSGFATLISLTDLESENRFQCVAYYLSAMSIIMPGMNAIAKRYLRSSGYRPEIVRIPSQVHSLMLVDLEPPMSHYEMYQTFAQMFFLLYKNITNANYDTFMKNRGAALKGLISGLREDDVDIMFQYDIAKTIRGLAGASKEIRRYALQWVMQLTNTGDFRAEVARYLMNIVEYTEMSAIPFIVEALVLTKSPVLWSNKLCSEVIHFKKAIDMVTSHAHPRFFRILSDGDTHALDRNNFPLLLEIAVELKKVSQPTLKNFARPRNDERARIIKEHVALHNNYVGPAPSRALQNAIEFLQDGEAEGGMRSVG